MRYSYTMSTAEIIKGTTSIDRRAKTLREDIQKVAVSILYGYHKSNDRETFERCANELTKALGDGMRRNSLQMWFIKHGGMVWNPTEKVLVRGVIKHSDINVLEAKNSPWEKTVAPEEPKPLDVYKEIERLAKRLEGDIKKHAEKSKVTPEMIATIRGLIKA